MGALLPMSATSSPKTTHISDLIVFVNYENIQNLTTMGPESRKRINLPRIRIISILENPILCGNLHHNEAMFMNSFLILGMYNTI
jgi:hypothetical protein